MLQHCGDAFFLVLCGSKKKRYPKKEIYKYFGNSLSFYYEKNMSCSIELLCRINFFFESGRTERTKIQVQDYYWLRSTKSIKFDKLNYWNYINSPHENWSVRTISLLSEMMARQKQYFLFIVLSLVNEIDG